MEKSEQGGPVADFCRKDLSGKPRVHEMSSSKR